MTKKKNTEPKAEKTEPKAEPKTGQADERKRMLEGLLEGAPRRPLGRRVVTTKPFGEILRSVRVRAGHSVAHVAERMGVTTQFVYLVEGSDNLREETVRRYCAAIDYEPRLVVRATAGQAPLPTEGRAAPIGHARVGVIGTCGPTVR